ncbi:peptide chain release factor subunit 1 [Striga asiatica]|uniref:Peptide chain release factor subunit 1 n=1 Tax=Striga asiatica TaxID=4170 RepID=A0A5A7QZY6_STRAF|nr:peptide chain release factor subunit 1 [Striga asiatica]
MAEVSSVAIDGASGVGSGRLLRKSGAAGRLLMKSVGREDEAAAIGPISNLRSAAPRGEDYAVERLIQSGTQGAETRPKATEKLMRNSGGCELMSNFGGYERLMSSPAAAWMLM